MFLKRFKNHFEDPDRPFLGPNVKLLKYGGLIFSKNIIIKYFFISVHCYLFIFAACELLDIWLERSNMEVVLRNLKYSMLSVVNWSKVYTYLKWQDDWIYIIDYITERDIERRNNEHPEMKDIINKYTKYARFVTFSFLYLVALTAIVVCMQPMLFYLSPAFRSGLKDGTEKRPEMVTAWMPFDTSTDLGYSISLFFQVVATFVAAISIIMFDTNAISIIIFMEADLRMLRIESRNIFGRDGKATLAEAKERIKSCHKKHLDTSQICGLFNDFMSPIMFLYAIVCSIMLCVTAYQIQNESSAVNKATSAQYLVFGVFQLFMYCWHSSTMLYSSLSLGLGPYESAWYMRQVGEKKDLLTLVHQFRKPLAVQAGPVVNLTLLTFLSILKGAYSFYTLLREMR